MRNTSLTFSILLTILTGGKVTKRYLADKFEISERTVIRYVEAIAAAGVPVYSVRGKNGGYSVSSEYQFDSAFFTDYEMKHLKALLAGEGGEISLAIADKLGYMSKRKRDAQFLIETDDLIIDAGTWHNPSLYRSKMETLQRAIDKHESLNMMYVDRYEAHTHRLFDPYCRILKDGLWYVYGWCHYREDFRLFKLARIKSLIETHEKFERKPSDVYAKLDGSFDDFETVNGEFEFSSTILGEIEEWLGFDAVTERGYKYVAVAELPVNRATTAKLLGFGSSIRIISPASVKNEIADECRRVLAKM